MMNRQCLQVHSNACRHSQYCMITNKAHTTWHWPRGTSCQQRSYISFDVTNVVMCSFNSHPVKWHRRLWRPSWFVGTWSKSVRRIAKIRWSQRHMVYTLRFCVYYFRLQQNRKILVLVYNKTKWNKRNVLLDVSSRVWYLSRRTCVGLWCTCVGSWFYLWQCIEIWAHNS